ncbi:cupin domain-containing protein [Brachybacterium sp. FME24]|uniref:cupin domain-containing protein n=1 Tax=Brachybacterium sp. FME24 TaxID=2742605 RepID=UPI00186945B4|nr:cupin [Brachybacterium sp. FME24]
MSFSKINSSDLSLGPGPHPAASPFDKRVSEPLGVSAFEVYKVELPPGARTEPHDHLADQVEDVYAIVRGSGWLVVDGRREPIEVGDFLAVAQASTRYVIAGESGCELIAMCA